MNLMFHSYVSRSACISLGKIKVLLKYDIKRFFTVLAFHFRHFPDSDFLNWESALMLDGYADTNFLDICSDTFAQQTE